MPVTVKPIELLKENCWCDYVRIPSRSLVQGACGSSDFFDAGFLILNYCRSLNLRMGAHTRHKVDRFEYIQNERFRGLCLHM